MLKFFRHIRKRLIMPDNVRKYLLYAIGEILLVVIGILIALQVNNWNEEHKLDQQINSALAEIREDLIQDQTAFRQLIAELKGDLSAQRHIIATIEQKRAFTDQTYRDLGRVMLLRRAIFSNNGYSLLSELGISNLKDKKLRNALVDYYSSKLNNVYREISDDEVEFNGTWIEYVRRNFKIWEFGEHALPNDDNQIKYSSYFLTMMKINLINRENTLKANITALKADSILVEAIDSKLNL